MGKTRIFHVISGVGKLQSLFRQWKCTAINLVLQGTSKRKYLKLK